MSENILLSFVIPVYNVEKYLNECLDSIFDPSVDDGEYEVIAVDDGSTDSSPEILKTYRHHKNFRTITKENSGEGLARNDGIEIAKGKYIGFVDADDCLLLGAVSKMLDMIVASDNDDIIEFGFTSNNESSQNVEEYGKNDRHPKFGRGKDVFVYWRQQGAYTSAVWSRLYRKEFLDVNSLRFVKYKVSLDSELQPRCFFYAEKVVYHPVKLYNYRRRDGSITLSADTYALCCYTQKRIEFLYGFLNTIEDNEDNARFRATIGGEILVPSFEWLINTMYRFVSKTKRKELINDLKKDREALGLATSKKGKRMYKLTRWLPARLAFRMYKIF